MDHTKEQHWDRTHSKMKSDICFSVYQKVMIILLSEISPDFYQEVWNDVSTLYSASAQMYATGNKILAWKSTQSTIRNY